MSLAEILVLATVMVPLAAMPSASVALVIAQTLHGGRIGGAMTAAGIVAGDLVFVAMALGGLAVLADGLGELFLAVKLLCAAYLLYFGWRLLRSAAEFKAASADPRAASRMGAFLAGLMLTLGDVKAILFYASLFPTLVDPQSLTRADVLIIILLTALTVGGVKLIYVHFAHRMAQGVQDRIPALWPRRVLGVLLMGCAAALIIRA